MNNLDVVIVNWNAGTQLLECLQSFPTPGRESGFHLSKCIIVDNASTDGSTDLVQSLSFPILLIENPENKGFAYASNQGARMGNSEYILFLNPDVRLFPGSLTRAIRFLDDSQNEKIGILGIQLLDRDGIVQRNAARFPTPDSIFHEMFGLDRLWPKYFPPMIMTDWDHQESMAVDQVQGAVFLMRRNVFDAINGFDEQFFMYFEDVDLALRARQAGWQTYYLATVQSFHRGGGTTYRMKARRLFYFLRSRVQFIAKYFGALAALRLIIATICIEFWTRLAWNFITLSWRRMLENAQAYGMFWREIPRLIKHLKPREG